MAFTYYFQKNGPAASCSALWRAQFRLAGMAKSLGYPYPGLHPGLPIFDLPPRRAWGQARWGQFNNDHSNSVISKLKEY